jgi:hypothetical protein
VGLDIQLVVESSASDAFSGPSGIAYFSPPRHTAMFTALAGMWENRCFIPARGFPDPASSMARAHYGRVVVDTVEDADSWGTATISRDWANECLESKRSHALDGTGEWVSAPEHAHAGWLRLHELKGALEFSELAKSQLSTDFQFAMNLMESIEMHGGFSRMVFWFDE